MPTVKIVHGKQSWPEIEFIPGQDSSSMSLMEQRLPFDVARSKVADYLKSETTPNAEEKLEDAKKALKEYLPPEDIENFVNALIGRDFGSTWVLIPNGRSFKVESFVILHDPLTEDPKARLR